MGIAALEDSFQQFHLVNCWHPPDLCRRQSQLKTQWGELFLDKTEGVVGCGQTSCRTHGWSIQHDWELKISWLAWRWGQWNGTHIMWMMWGQVLRRSFTKEWFSPHMTFAPSVPIPTRFSPRNDQLSIIFLKSMSLWTNTQYQMTIQNFAKIQYLKIIQSWES